MKSLDFFASGEDRGTIGFDFVESDQGKAPATSSNLQFKGEAEWVGVARDALRNCRNEYIDDKLEHSVTILSDQYSDSEWVAMGIDEGSYEDNKKKSEWSAISRSEMMKQRSGGGGGKSGRMSTKTDRDGKQPERDGRQLSLGVKVVTLEDGKGEDEEEERVVVEQLEAEWGGSYPCPSTVLVWRVPQTIMTQQWRSATTATTSRRLTDEEV